MLNLFGQAKVWLLRNCDIRMGFLFIKNILDSGHLELPRTSAGLCHMRYWKTTQMRLPRYTRIRSRQSPKLTHALYTDPLVSTPATSST